MTYTCKEVLPNWWVQFEYLLWFIFLNVIFCFSLMRKQTATHLILFYTDCTPKEEGWRMDQLKYYGHTKSSKKNGITSTLRMKVTHFKNKNLNILFTLVDYKFLVQPQPFCLLTYPSFLRFSLSFKQWICVCVCVWLCKVYLDSNFSSKQV